MKRLAALLEKHDAMEKHFEERTAYHIKLVQKYCQRIFEHGSDRFPDIIERGKMHDASKFIEPERAAYILINWKYKCKDDSIKFTPSKADEEKMANATEHHIRSNDHHPEYHCTEAEVVSRANRNEGPTVDTTKMPLSAIAEMVADWCAMSEELRNYPQEWAGKVVNVRYKFTSEQVTTINELIAAIWSRTNKEEGMKRLEKVLEDVKYSELKRISDLLSTTIRNELTGKHSNEPTKKITGSELDRESDYLWDLVNSPFEAWAETLDFEGQGAAGDKEKKVITDFKKYHAEDAENLIKWFKMAINNYRK